MKKGKYAGSNISMNPLSSNTKAAANNLQVPQSPVAEPKSRILSWNWEPLHETYVFHKKVKGAA